MADGARGARRSPKVPGGRKFKHLVWVSEDEEAALQRAAVIRGVTVARMLREGILNTHMRALAGADAEAVYVELRAMRMLTANVAKNVNQVAKVANSTGRVTGDLSELHEFAMKTFWRINKALDWLAQE